ncbi:MAG: ABC transporter permease [SAR116 cluster bacterium]|jgi:putative spermidine/putrescine transport system permease protein|nr:MAG: ABC transporter permease [SAR116 cluster bacterium]
MQTWVEKVILFVWCGFSYVFLLSPMVVVMGASLHGGEFSAAIKFPPEDPSFQWYSKIPMQQFEALGLSLIVAAVATFLAALIAVPAALGLVRSNFKGKFIVTTIFRAPLQIPAIVSGIAFLQFYYLIYDNSSLMLAGTIPGMLIGHVFIATPFLFGTIVAVLQRFDHRLEEAAHSLGAGKWRTLYRVTIPTIMPGIYSGGLYAFMVSFADVPMSIFLTAPGFVTYPVELFYALENDFDPSILASSSLVIIFCLIMLLGVQKMVGLETLLRSGGGSAR